MKKRVAVLLGGLSSERQVSLVSGGAIADAVETLGHEAHRIDVDRNLGAVLAALKPDLVINALHGKYGEDGRVQGLLDLMNIPYSHSGVLASAMAMDKPVAKKMVSAAGVPVAEGIVARRADILANDPMSRPYVVKPKDEGSSVGVIIVREMDNGPALAQIDWPFGEEVMVERYIPGRELTVGVMGDRALCVTEILTTHHFYDYDAKYAAGGSTHVLPAPVKDEIANEAKRLALVAHQTLGCRGVSRSDFRYHLEEDKLYFLEINTQPGMTPTSLVPEQAAHLGMSFPDLVRWMMEDVSCPR